MDIKQSAIASAERFQKCWDFDDFWKRSNTFHSFLRFVRAAELRWPNDPALAQMSALRMEMIKKNYNFFLPKLTNDACWADDYGWCGISCVAARDFLMAAAEPVLAQQYLDLADGCWRRMLEVGYDHGNTATPVPHGCSNTSVERKAQGDDGTKNTVTNANFLLLSLNLYAVTGQDKYRQTAYAQYVWFTTWFGLKYPSLDDGPYLRGEVTQAPGAHYLVHERPMAEKSYTSQTDPGHELGLVWSGDQGLVALAFAQLYRMREGFAGMPEFDAALVLRYGNWIIGGINHYLFSKVDKVLHEAPFKALFWPDGTNFAPDYVGGRGVLLRLMSETPVTSMLKAPFNPEGVQATAQAVWNSRDEHNQFPSSWKSAGDNTFNEQFIGAWGSGDGDATKWNMTDSGYYGVLQANGMDALTAAMRLA